MSRGRAPSHPGDAPAPRRVPPWGFPQTSHPARAAKALPEAPGLEARVPGSGALGGMEPSVPCLAPGHVSGSSVVVPSLAEQDTEEQQDRGCEAHPGEILHPVVWGEVAQVSAGPVTRKWGVRPGHQFLGEDMTPEPSP